MTDRRHQRLADLVDVHHRGPIDLGPVVGAARTGDVEVAVLTDEELHWLGAHPDAAPKPYLHAPRLARLGEAEQQAALAAALWIMTARGEFDGSTDPPRSFGVHAIVGSIRREPAAMAMVRTDQRGAGTRRQALYATGPELVLVEDVADSGLHRFVFRSTRLAAVALAAQVDPLHRATTTAPPCTAVTPADLEPSPEAMVRTCEASSLLYGATRVDAELLEAQALTVYSGPDGVWALAGRQAGPDDPAQVTWQQLDRTALEHLLLAFLQATPAGQRTPPRPPDVRPDDALDRTLAALRHRRRRLDAS